jgi:hypothetical protein
MPRGARYNERLPEDRLRLPPPTRDRKSASRERGNQKAARARPEADGRGP